MQASGDRNYDLDQRIDRLVTSPIFGLPIMLVSAGVVFWVTIVGANVSLSVDCHMLVLVRGQGRGAVHCRWASPGGSPASSGTACIAAWPG